MKFAANIRSSTILAFVCGISQMRMASAAAAHPVAHCLKNIEPNDPAWAAECKDACRSDGYYVYCSNNGMVSTNEDFLECICMIDSNCHVLGSVTMESTTTSTTSTTTTINPMPYCSSHIGATNAVWLDSCQYACHNPDNLDFCRSQGNAITEEAYLACVCGIDSNCVTSPGAGIVATSTSTERPINPIPYCRDHIEANDAVWEKSCKKACNINLGYCRSVGKSNEVDYLDCVLSINGNCHDGDGAPVTTKTPSGVDSGSYKEYCAEHIVATDPVWTENCRESCENDGNVEYCTNTNSINSGEEYIGCIASINQNCHT